MGKGRTPLIAGIFALVLMVMPAQAQDFNEGVRAYNRGDYETALSAFRPLAEQGHASAQYNLGVMYRNGKGVAQDYREAVRWYRLAAEQGDASAQYNLGVMYANGEGMAQDYITAHVWLNIAAANGNTKASENRDIAASHLSGDVLIEAQRLARQCLNSNYQNCP